MSAPTGLPADRQVRCDYKRLALGRLSRRSQELTSDEGAERPNDQPVCPKQRAGATPKRLGPCLGRHQRAALCRVYPKVGEHLHRAWLSGGVELIGIGTGRAFPEAPGLALVPDDDLPFRRILKDEERWGAEELPQRHVLRVADPAHDEQESDDGHVRQPDLLYGLGDPLRRRCPT